MVHIQEEILKQGYQRYQAGLLVPLIITHAHAKLGHSVFNYLLPQEYEYRGYPHSYGPS